MTGREEGTMNTTTPTDTAGMKDQDPASDPVTSHRPRRRTAAAVAVVTAAAAGAVGVAATPVLAFISNQHNETLVRSPRGR